MAAGLHARGTLDRPRPPRSQTAALLPVQVVRTLSFGAPKAPVYSSCCSLPIATRASRRARAPGVKALRDSPEQALLDLVESRLHHDPYAVSSEQFDQFVT